MLATEVQTAARKLMEVHGTKAIAEAAQKAVSFENNGNDDQARDWRKIEAALKQMQGPHAS